MNRLPTAEQKAEAKLFLASRRDWTEWRGMRLLGQGPHSIVGLFSRSRMFKSRHFKREKQYAAVKETDNYHHYLERGQLPEEVMALTKLKPFKCNTIIKLLKWGPLPTPEDVEYQKYRVYTEYCQFGDLGRLLYRHRRYGKYLVEPFLWNIFYHLAKALVVLEHGPQSQSLLGMPIEDDMLDSDETSADESSLELNDNCTEPFGCQPQHENDWKPIVHNDIKPQNIFLGDEDFDTFSFYPTAKLGDFGNAFIYTPRESQEAVLAGGTGNYQPPDDRKGPWSNIYGVGVCMFEAVTLEDHVTSQIVASYKQKGKMKEESAKVEGSKSSDLSRAEDHLFDWRCRGRTPCSQRLELLILRCLKGNVKDRITAPELLSETRKALSQIRHELKKEYGLDAGPRIDSDGKKKPTRLPNGYPFKLDYHGSEIEGTPYGNYVCSFRKPPYLQDYYFPELYVEGSAPMRFPMREDFKSINRKNLDHLRMPWETADEWNARERDWAGDKSGKEGNDKSDDMDNISLYSVEQPASDADGAGNEWMTDSETKAELEDAHAAEDDLWAPEAEQKLEDDAQTKKKAKKAAIKFSKRLLARLAKRRNQNRDESPSPPREKRRKLTSTSDEADERGGAQAEEDETESEEDEIESEEDEEEDEDEG